MSQASQELLPLVLALWKMFHRGGRFLEAAVIVAEGTVSASLLTSLVQLIERSLFLCPNTKVVLVFLSICPANE